MTVVVTMAGRGVRFAKAGYLPPKYAIVARGRPVFDWAVESLRAFFEREIPLVFVSLARNRAASFVEARAAHLGIRRYEIVQIPEVTRGQAETVLEAAPFVRDPQGPLFVYNIDTYVAPGLLHPGSMRGDGWIPCFRAPGHHWSFARADEDGRVVEVREKVRVSDDATVGLYGFSSLALFLEAYERVYGVSDGDRSDRGERYVAPLYDDLIRHGRSVFLSRLPDGSVRPLGTPAELRAYERGGSSSAQPHPAR